MANKKILFIILLIAILTLIVTGILVLNKNISNLEEIQKIVTAQNVEENIVNGAFSVNDNEETSQPKLEELESVTLDNTGDYIEINEQWFMTELNDIYLNCAEYEGKTIEYEGFVYNHAPTNSTVVGREYYCCGYDAYVVGFEAVSADGENILQYENDVWLKIKGTIRIKKQEGVADYPVIEIIEVTEIEANENRVVYN